MTARELFDRLKMVGISTDKVQLKTYSDKGLNMNTSSIFSTLVKAAGICDHYNSDIYYDMKEITEKLEDFDPSKAWEPIFVGVRDMGVDGTPFVLSRIKDVKDIDEYIRNYYYYFFAIDVEQECDYYYKVIFYQYETSKVKYRSFNVGYRARRHFFTKVELSETQFDIVVDGRQIEHVFIDLNDLIKEFKKENHFKDFGIRYIEEVPYDGE